MGWLEIIGILFVIGIAVAILQAVGAPIMVSHLATRIDTLKTEKNTEKLADIGLGRGFLLSDFVNDVGENLWKLRIQALRALVEVGGEQRTIEILENALSDKNPKISNAACEALMILKQESGIQGCVDHKLTHLASVVIKDEDPELRKIAIRVYQGINLQDTEPDKGFLSTGFHYTRYLLEALNRETDPEVISTIINALGQFKGEKASQVMIEALGPAGSTVVSKMSFSSKKRAGVIKASGEIAHVLPDDGYGRLPIADALIKETDSGDPSVAAAAASALQRCDENVRCLMCHQFPVEATPFMYSVEALMKSKGGPYYAAAPDSQFYAGHVCSECLNKLGQPEPEALKKALSEQLYEQGGIHETFSFMGRNYPAVKYSVSLRAPREIYQA